MSDSDSGTDPGKLDETFASPDVPTIDSHATHEHANHEPQATLDSGSQPTKFASTFEEASIGRYEIVGEIARGGMGVVYEALDKSLNRTVALKMILSGRFASERDVRRFYQEAEAAANLDHPGIVPVYEVGEHEGHHYFTMKLMEGGSLAEAMAEVRADPRSSAEMISKITRAVYYAHQRGILHRDLKPANILLDSEGNPMVADLGLAKDTASDKNDITRSGAILGSPAYMSPEQAAGQKDVTTAADIYAIGAMLYELLTERTPHVGETPIELIRKVLDDDIALPRSLNAKTDRTLELICMKCLARDPADRYSSAGALADDLDHWLAGEPVSVRPPSIGSTISNFLSQNLRSVLGVMFVSLLVGSCVGTALWSTSPFKRDGSAYATVYNLLPNETLPNSWAPDLPVGEVIGVVFLVAFLSLGLVNVLLTKPTSAAQALTIGLVSGLVVMLCLFTLAFGPGSIQMRVLKPIEDDIYLSSRIALSPSEDQEVARRMLGLRRPDFKSLPTGKDGGKVMYNKIRADGLLHAPGAIISGLLAAALMSLLPVVGGTCLASRLVHQKKHLGWAAFSYYEAIVGAVVLSLMVGFGVVGGKLMDLTGDESYWPGPYFPAMFVACVAAVIFAIVRGWKWPTRILLHVCWITIAVFFFREISDMSQGETTISRMLVANDIEGAAERLETWTRRNPRNQDMRWMAGVVQAYRGNEERYQHHCSQFLEVLNGNMNTSHCDNLSRLGLLRPSTPIRKEAIHFGKEAYELTKRTGLWDNSARMLVAYREDDFAEVERIASKISFSNPAKMAPNLKCLKSLFETIEAMSLIKSGKTDEGKQLLRLAQNQFWAAKRAVNESKNPGDNAVRLLTIEMLLDEAMSLK